jgi:hypothetical protein
MRNGDLANTAVPRIIIVFENAIGYLPESRRAEWRRLSRKNRWDDVASLFDLDQIMLRKMNDLARRFSVHIDVVTYCGPEAFARALERVFERENVLVRIVTASTPERVARRTSYESDIVSIYDANQAHRLVYGPKGVYLTDYRQLGG